MTPTKRTGFSFFANILRLSPSVRLRRISLSSLSNESLLDSGSGASFGNSSPTMASPMFYAHGLLQMNPLMKMGERWVGPDLNRRPRHLQCRALPTKLPTLSCRPRGVGFQVFVVHSCPDKTLACISKREAKPISAQSSSASSSSR